MEHEQVAGGCKTEEQLYHRVHTGSALRQQQTYVHRAVVRAVDVTSIVGQSLTVASVSAIPRKNQNSTANGSPK